jgi:hypothetical protein
MASYGYTTLVLLTLKMGNSLRDCQPEQHDSLAGNDDESLNLKDKAALAIAYRHLQAWQFSRSPRLFTARTPRRPLQ